MNNSFPSNKAKQDYITRNSRIESEHYFQITPVIELTKMHHGPDELQTIITCNNLTRNFSNNIFIIDTTQLVTRIYQCLSSVTHLLIVVTRVSKVINSSPHHAHTEKIIHMAFYLIIASNSIFSFDSVGTNIKIFMLDIILGTKGLYYGQTTGLSQTLPLSLELRKQPTTNRSQASFGGWLSQEELASSWRS